MNPSNLSKYEKRLNRAYQEGLISVSNNPLSKLHPCETRLATYSHVKFADIHPPHKRGSRILPTNSRGIGGLQAIVIDILTKQRPNGFRYTELGAGLGVIFADIRRRIKSICSVELSNVALAPADPYSIPKFVVSENKGSNYKDLDLIERDTNAVLHTTNRHDDPYTLSKLEALEEELVTELFEVLDKPYIHHQVIGRFPYVELPTDQHGFGDQLGCFYYTGRAENLEMIHSAMAKDGIFIVEEYMSDNDPALRRNVYHELREPLDADDQLLMGDSSLLLVKKGNPLCAHLSKIEGDMRYDNGLNMANILIDMRGETKKLIQSKSA